MAADRYILGAGVLTIGTADIALTRGGGEFMIEREYKEVEADGDQGPVKGRIRKDRSVAKITFNLLQIISENMAIMHPGIDVDSTTVSGTATITGKAIEDADYNDTVKWTGETSDGKSVVIELENAINLNNISWPLLDKDEVVENVVFTGTYLNTARTTEPWSIDFVDPA